MPPEALTDRRTFEMWYKLLLFIPYSDFLADEFMGTGRHEIPFDGSDLASGAYYYRLEGGGPVQTRSMMLVK